MEAGRLPTQFYAFVLAATAQLSRLTYRLTGDVHEADDLLQEALLRVARRWRRARRPRV